MLFSLLLLTKIALFHPFHVSVCDIEYDSREKQLKISVRIFLDDFEKALRLQTGDRDLDILDAIDSATLHPEIRRYLNEKLEFRADGKRLSPEYLGGERDIDVFWLYLEVRRLRKFDTFAVENRLLLEVFDDQENLVHVRRDGKVRSSRLGNERKETILQWD